MKLLKLVCFLFLIYFIRRFIQMYKVMKKVQEEQALKNTTQNQNVPPKNDAINAEFKVVD